MRKTTNRRQFLKNISRGVIPAALTFSLIRQGYSLALFSLQDPEDKSIPRISPAYRVNVYQDGSVELFTHDASGNKKTELFNGLEADILLIILEENNPKAYNQQLGTKYSLEKEDYISKVDDALQSFENRGFIYYGEIMLVKIQKIEND